MICIEDPDKSILELDGMTTSPGSWPTSIYYTKLSFQTAESVCLVIKKEFKSHYLRNAKEVEKTRRTDDNAEPEKTKACGCLQQAERKFKHHKIRWVFLCLNSADVAFFTDDQSNVGHTLYLPRSDIKHRLQTLPFQTVLLRFRMGGRIETVLESSGPGPTIARPWVERSEVCHFLEIQHKHQADLAEYSTKIEEPPVCEECFSQNNTRSGFDLLF